MNSPWYGQVTILERLCFVGLFFLRLALVHVVQLVISSKSKWERFGTPSTCLYASLIILGDRCIKRWCQIISCAFSVNAFTEVLLWINLWNRSWWKQLWTVSRAFINSICSRCYVHKLISLELIIFA